MIYSELKFGKEAQEELLKGVKLLSRAVKSTLGPTGRNVAIAHSNQYGEIWQRRVIHDGVEVAKSIMLRDEFQDMGAQLLKEAAEKQVMEVGDGTTVSIVLAEAIYEELFTLIAANVNPMTLRKSIEDQVEKLVAQIEKLAIPVTTIGQLRQIATISAQNEWLGGLVADTMWKMGKDGLVVPEPSKNAETRVENQKGMQIDKGWLHPYFMTNPAKLEATFEDPVVLVTDKSINSLVPLKALLEWAHAHSKRLVIFTPHVGEEALGLLIDNKLRGIVYSLVISAPSFGDDQKNKLQDIAIYTGAKYITEAAGHKFEDINPETDLGTCQYITATKTESIIVSGKGSKDAIAARVEEIKTSITETDVEFDREKMKERLAKFTTGVAVIHVGGATEVEMKERMERVKDAIAACRAAQKKGIVPGGEIVYLVARNNVATMGKAGGVELMAHNLMQAALYKPFCTLLQNAGMNDGEWYNKLQSAPKNSGVNVLKGEIVDMVKEGIIDPVLVPIHALRNAASVAIMLATTGCVNVQHLDKETQDPKRAPGR